jgi:DNA-binding response OmpR family regulator
MRFLLVEDEPRVARFIGKGLREQGYAVDTAQDGEDALYKVSIFDGFPPPIGDAVINDLIVVLVFLPVFFLDGLTPNRR